MVEPLEIFSITGDPVVRHYDFCIKHGVGVRSQSVLVQVYNFLERTCRMSDGSQKIYTKDNDPEKPFYALIIDTEIGFAEALAKFRGIGVTGKARIRLLSYGGNVVRNVGDNFLDKIDKMSRGEQDLEFASRSEYQSSKSDESVRYHNTPFIVADLDKSFVRDVEESVGVMFMRIDCEKTPVTDDFSVTYQIDETTDGLQKRIGYLDNKVVQPRVRQLLETASFELSEKEKRFLEEVVSKAILI